MNSAAGLLLMAVVLFVSDATAASLDSFSVSSSIELRIEVLANRIGEPVERCQVVQARSLDSTLSFASWSTFGETPFSATGPSGKEGDNAVRATGHCGAGSFPGTSPAPSGTTLAPFLILEVSTTVGWDSGTMDPGPVGAVRIHITLTSRQLTGFSTEGEPLYSGPVTERRFSRLEPGEEQIVPVPVDAHGLQALRAHEVLLRIRAGWAGREGATEYGAVSVKQAAPGSEVVLDGGVAGRAGGDGSLLLANVPVGQREVRIRGASGPAVTRTVSVVKGRTILVSPEATGGGSPPQPCLTATARNPEGFQEYRRVRDGAVMIQIPEGEFLMGNLETEGAPLPHTVYVSTFLIDKLPLTVGRYEQFAAATGRPLPPDPYWGVHEDFPVAFIRWDEAKAYCEWAGGRLPTEAEREKAARGTDGRTFPWGSEPPSPERAVYGRYWGEEGPDAVGIRPSGASPYGMLDPEGNMWEFCEDWWGADYFETSPAKDPAGPKTGRARVARGGSWDSRWVTLHAARRNFAYKGYREGDFGFRCASDPPR
jgi:formylglycine-generating enzyme required for sulfatase activity